MACRRRCLIRLRRRLAEGDLPRARALLEEALQSATMPEAPDWSTRAEIELALARALGDGPRAVSLMRHGRDVLARNPLGPRRARLVAEADVWLLKAGNEKDRREERDGKGEAAVGYGKMPRSE